MNELQIFRYQGSEIRTIEKEDGVWWVLADVCRVLDVKNATDVARRLDSDEVARFNLGGLSGEAWIVSESGLYNVILRSDKPEAVPFRRWVTHEVLPAIRRHGAYMTTETLEAAILNPDYLLKVVAALKDERDKRRSLEAANASLAVQNQIMAPKADYFDELVDRNLLTGFRETAKQLGVKEKDFLRFLMDKRYIYRDKKGKLMPYADKNNGLFEVKECFNEKTAWSGTQTFITPKGRETFRLLCPR